MPTCKKGHSDVNEYTIDIQSPAGKKAKLSFNYCGECDDIYGIKAV